MQFLADNLRVEGGQAFGPTEEELPSGALIDGIRPEFVALETVVFVVTGYPARLLVDAVQAVCR